VVESGHRIGFNRVRPIKIAEDHRFLCCTPGLATQARNGSPQSSCQCLEYPPKFLLA
jgi:hypothetical protein